LAGAAAIVVAGAASTATAETAGDVLQTAMERNDARLKGIETFTVVQDVMGFEVTTHYETQLVDGHVVPVAKETEEESADASASLYASLPEMAERARLEDTETIDDRKCYTIRVEDMSELDFAPDMGEATAAFTPKSLVFHLDQKDYLLRKMRIEGEAEHEGRQVPLSMEMVPSDYRTVDGLVHPFEITMVVHGLASAMSAEDTEKARQALAEMKAQMEEMPEEQRKMMVSMMGDRMQRMEEMVGSGEVKTTMKVKEIRVNQPAP
jgi:hypothetical protein